MHLLVNIILSFSKKLRRENLHRIILVVVIFTLFSSLLYWRLEKNVDFQDAVWWSIVTMTTVGYGDLYPATQTGRLLGVVVMLFGIGFLGILTATIASIFIESKIMENRGMKAINAENHFVVGGWNYTGPDIIAELRADEKSRNIPIVIICPLDENPFDGKNVFFVKGDLKKDALDRANAAKAQTVILLPDDHHNAEMRDAKTILNTLTIKSLYPHVRVCVELSDAQNIEHCRQAKADEIIVVGELSTNLLVQAALDPGVSEIITELVSNRYGTELYRINVPEKYHGKTFLEMLTDLKTQHEILCLGIENKQTRKLTTNPESRHIMNANDALVVIAEERPEF